MFVIQIQAQANGRMMMDVSMFSLFTEVQHARVREIRRLAAGVDRQSVLPSVLVVLRKVTRLMLDALYCSTRYET